MRPICIKNVDGVHQMQPLSRASKGPGSKRPNDFSGKWGYGCQAKGRQEGFGVHSGEQESETRRVT